MHRIVDRIKNNQMLNENYEKFKQKFENFIDLSTTIKNIGKWITNWHLTSVDFTGILLNEFNTKKYCFNCIHFGLYNICNVFLILFICIDSLWQLVDNQFLPRNTRILLILAEAVGLITASLRFDVLYDEWHNHLRIFKFAYYLQENRQLKDGLNKRNHFKLSTFTKLIEILIVKIYQVVLDLGIILICIYIIINANNLVLYLLFPLVLYWMSIMSSTVAIGFLLAFLVAYYYKLLFDQINDQIETIYKRSTNSLSIVCQLHLIKLIKKHQIITKQMYQLNIFICRTALIYFIVITLFQIIVLNLYFDSDSLFYKIAYIVLLSASITFGFGVVFLSSLQINSAHKPAKLIRKILYKSKRKLNFYFKWKVIDLIFN